MLNRPVPHNLRLEIKFVAPEPEMDRLRQWIRLHSAGFYSPYEPRWVNNVYFDTYQYFSIAENLAGASRRAKLRYRWYGEAEYPGPGMLEAKCKRNSFGWKHAFEAESPYEERADWRDIHRRLWEQMDIEGKRWLEAHPHPVLINRYLRQYYVSRDGKVRATIDVKQRMFDQRYKPHPNVTHVANIPRTLILELKFAPEDRGLATSIIRRLPVRLSRHSKYLTGASAIFSY